MKQRFAAAADTNALRVKLGVWRPTADRVRPGWAALAKAKVWVDPGFKALREALATPRPLPQLSVSTETTLASVRGGGNVDGSGKWLVEVFSAAPGAPVPAAALGKNVRLTLVDVEEVERSGWPTPPPPTHRAR